MRTLGLYILSMLSLIAWALWLGGMVALITFVVTLFLYHRPIAPEAATALFDAFEIFQFIVGPVAILSTFFWYGLNRSFARLMLLTLLVIAGVCMVIEAAFVTPNIRAMYKEGTTQTDQFKAIHKRSETIYNIQGTALLLASFAMAAALRPRITPLPTPTPAKPLPPTDTPPSAAKGPDFPA